MEQNPFEEEVVDDMQNGAPMPVGMQIVEYHPTSMALAVLRTRFAGAVYDVATPGGMAAAKEARKELAGYRTRLENMRKKIKAPALEKARLIDAEAKIISVQIAELEDPIARLILAEENRIERERIEREQAETGRVAAIQARIEEIRRLPQAIAGLSAQEITRARNELLNSRLDPDWLAEFGEYGRAAQDAAGAAILALTDLLDQRIAAEAEAERLAAERAELEQLRAEAQARKEAVAKNDVLVLNAPPWCTEAEITAAFASPVVFGEIYFQCALTVTVSVNADLPRTRITVSDPTFGDALREYVSPLGDDIIRAIGELSADVASRFGTGSPGEIEVRESHFASEADGAAFGPEGETS